MLITGPNLIRLQAGFQAVYQQAFDAAQSTYERVAMTVPSGTAEEIYGWMNDLPGMREWIGDRVIHNVGTSEFVIKNKHWELTIGVDRDNITDDRLGVYQPMFANMGDNARRHPDLLVWALLPLGFARSGPDNQYFFDADHQGWDENGLPISVSNMQAGAGPAWYLIDARRPIKPLVYQPREALNFVRLDRPEDPNVFFRKTYVYGIDGRYNAGFGLWQLAFGSKAPLNATNYAAARAAMAALRRKDGSPLGVKGNLLIVPGGLESAGRKLIINDRNDAGASNEWVGTAELLVSEWL